MSEHVQPTIVQGKGLCSRKCPSHFNGRCKLDKDPCIIMSPSHHILCRLWVDMMIGTQGQPKKELGAQGEVDKLGEALRDNRLKAGYSEEPDPAVGIEVSRAESQLLEESHKEEIEKLRAENQLLKEALEGEIAGQKGDDSGS